LALRLGDRPRHTNPIIGISGAMRELAGGNRNVSIPVSGTDEVGVMADTLQVFRAT
jgi:hypothetical protein